MPLADPNDTTPHSDAPATSRSSGRTPTSLVSVLLKRIAALELELAIRNAENESARRLHKEECEALEKQCDALTAEAMLRQIAQQRAERRLMEARGGDDRILT